MDVLDYLKLLRRRWRLIAAAVLLSIVAAWVTTPAATPQRVVPLGTSYKATHTLLQSPEAKAPVNLELTRLFATTGEIPRRAAVRLGRSPEEGPLLASQVQISVDATVGSLAVSSVGSDGPRVAAIANAFAAEILNGLGESAQRDREAELADSQRVVDALAKKVAALDQAIARQGGEVGLLGAQRDATLERYTSAFSRLQILTEQGAPKTGLMTLEAAVPIPLTTTGSFTAPTSRSARVSLAALIGLVLGALLALVVEHIDTRLRTKEAAEEVTGLPVLAEVPPVPRPQRRLCRVATAQDPGSAVAEAYRTLRSTVMRVPSPRDARSSTPAHAMPQVVLVTSPLPGDGKTSTLVNLAACLAETGRRVLVLDCDFRKPSAHRYLDVPVGRGMSDLLSGTLQADVDELARPTSVRGVRLVSAGTVQDHSATLLSRARPLIERAMELADVVLIDAAPVLVANDACDLLPHVDTTLLVIRSGRTTSHQALRTAELLGRLGTDIAGTVLIGSSGAMTRSHHDRFPSRLLLSLRRRGAGAPQVLSAPSALPGLQPDSLLMRSDTSRMPVGLGWPAQSGGAAAAPVALHQAEPVGCSGAGMWRKHDPAQPRGRGRHVLPVGAPAADRARQSDEVGATPPRIHRCVTEGGKTS